MAKLSEREVVAMDVMQERGRSMRGIARELGVDESTVRYRLGRLRSGVQDGRRQQAEACAAWDEVIGAWIADQSRRQGRPDPVCDLYDHLVADHGFPASYKAVLRYVRRRMGRPPIRPIRRVETAPGAQAQVDWFERLPVRVVSMGERDHLDALVVALSHSRMPAVIWAPSRSLLWWLACHNQAFTWLGGIPWTVRVDNVKTAVKRGAGPWASLNDGYAAYAAQLGFTVDPARPYKGSDKGKVERRGRDVRAALAPLSDVCFLSLEDLQAATDRHIEARAKRLTCPVTGTSVYEAWQAEREHLMPLPATLPEPFDVLVHRKVSDDCLVAFEGRSYQVPFAFVRQTVQVRGCAGIVEIHATDGAHLASYPRGTACRLLLDQRHTQGLDSEMVLAPTPLGRIGRAITLERSWEVGRRGIDAYCELVRRLA